MDIYLSSKGNDGYHRVSLGDREVFLTKSLYEAKMFIEELRARLSYTQYAKILELEKENEELRFRISVLEGDLKEARGEDVVVFDHVI